jgi:hypothetical protein
LEKRILAILIDGFVFGAIYTLLKDFVIPEPFFKLGLISYLILFIPLFCKDMLFGNASLGKKVMGIKIYTTDWKKPTPLLLFKRALFMMTKGYLIWMKSTFAEKNDIAVFDYEREVLGTYAIEDAVCQKLKKEANAKSGSFESNMSELYTAYLRSLYLKQK